MFVCVLSSQHVSQPQGLLNLTRNEVCPFISMFPNDSQVSATDESAVRVSRQVLVTPTLFLCGRSGLS